MLELVETKEKELIRKVKIEQFGKTGEYSLSSVVRSLRDMGFSLDNAILSYYNDKEGLYVFGGKLPLITSDKIPKEAL